MSGTGGDTTDIPTGNPTTAAAAAGGDDGQPACCAVTESSASSPSEPERAATWHILLCCSGSVASLKVPELAGRLLDGPADAGPPRTVQLRVLSTERARHFFSPDDLPAGVHHLSDSDEWTSWRARGDPVQHIVQRDWADALLVAPTSANTLAKLAHGLADGLVTCVARAWPLGVRPALLAPAMNTGMWRHPVTAPQLRLLQRWGYTLLPPVQKTLVCGETGVGAMAEVADICGATFELLREADAKRSGTPTATGVDCKAAAERDWDVEGEMRLAEQRAVES